LVPLAPVGGAGPSEVTEKALPAVSAGGESGPVRRGQGEFAQVRVGADRSVIDGDTGEVHRAEVRQRQRAA
jgi:hypothetical protein